MIEDLALMRVLPGMRVLVPADYHSAKAAIRLAALTPGPFYVRLGRAALPEVYSANAELEVGGANVLRSGSDVTIIACGVMVAQALAAADILAASDVSAEVIDAYSIKPLDEETILRSARKTGGVVTCEEHSIIGGLGSAVAELLSEHVPTRIARVGVRDVFGTSGEPDELMAHYGLMAADIANTAQAILSR
jgi:transketolase